MAGFVYAIPAPTEQCQSEGAEAERPLCCRHGKRPWHAVKATQQRRARAIRLFARWRRARGGARRHRPGYGRPRRDQIPPANTHFTRRDVSLVHTWRHAGRARQRLVNVYKNQTSRVHVVRLQMSEPTWGSARFARQHKSPRRGIRIDGAIRYL